jgi:hypothetical protein
MTTKARGITLPAYKYIFPSETAGVGILVTSAGSTAAKDTWAYKAGSIAPYNAAPATAVAPQAFTLTGQNATSSFASTGGDINLLGGTGSVSNASGNVVIKDTAGNGGAWNNSHAVLGAYHLWVDSTGRLRIKSGAPTSDTDGSIVGTQS